MNFISRIAVLCLFSASIWACESKPATAEKSPTPAATAEAKPADVSGSVKALLADYESIRKALAGDSTAGVSDAAKKVAEGARGAEKAATGPTKERLTAIAAAADALTNEKGDIEAVRTAFGGLSKAVLSLLSGDTALQQGLHVFECPMAKPYKKWVQPSDKLENPYMGKKMSECGAEADWKA